MKGLYGQANKEEQGKSRGIEPDLWNKIQGRYYASKQRQGNGPFHALFYSTRHIL